MGQTRLEIDMLMKIIRKAGLFSIVCESLSPKAAQIITKNKHTHGGIGHPYTVMVH